MILYNKKDITISTIEEEDKEKVLEYFSENDFNCDYETGALRPSNEQFIKIMDKIISGRDKANSILVLKRDNEVLGYASIFIDYDKIKIGHIAVNRQERGKGYGTLLTKMVIAIASNEGRDVALYCSYPNNCFVKLGFKETMDKVHFFYKTKKKKVKNLPTLFMTIEEYRQKKKEEMKKETESFERFLNSDIAKRIFDL